MMSTFKREMQTIMKIHEVECLRASDPKCSICGSPTVKVLQTPMSWLHRVHDPFIAVQVNQICNNGKCEIAARQEIQHFMMEAALQGPASFDRIDTQEILMCKVCGKTEDVKRCGRCKEVSYCGKDHQKADWKVHKSVCKAL